MWTQKKTKIEALWQQIYLPVNFCILQSTSSDTWNIIRILKQQVYTHRGHTRRVITNWDGEKRMTSLLVIRGLKVRVVFSTTLSLEKLVTSIPITLL